MAMIGGAIGLIVKLSAFQDWYLHLNKPWFGPSDNLLSVVWVFIHVLLGITGYLLWHNTYHEGEEKTNTDGIFILLYLQLVLTFGWMWIFFGLQLPLVAFFEKVISLVVLILMVKQSFKISKFVSSFYAVYTLWTLYLLAFNLSIIQLNR